ncbi:hypothetical protein [Enterobacter hormaechei]|uniref:hypothetical protein n=1 Tax=Enterobacter hormaechei TaxID=158836 RepID=UPI002A754DB6|nr:hypothetical protein [Enterobacter hormaechei]MDY3570257.1 hypothetical protein [Enterobacter hormaechei]
MMITITTGMIAGWLVGFMVAFIALSIYDRKMYPYNGENFVTTLTLAVFWPCTLALLVLFGIAAIPLLALNWCYKKLAAATSQPDEEDP